MSETDHNNPDDTSMGTEHKAISYHFDLSTTNHSHTTTVQTSFAPSIISAPRVHFEVAQTTAGLAAGLCEQTGTRGTRCSTPTDHHEA